MNKKDIRRKASALAFSLVMVLAIFASVPTAMAEDPHITLDKSASPIEIFLEGDGGMPDTTTVTLGILGAGDPIPGEETYAPTDVVFVVDDTGSMGDDIDQVKSDITYITDTLVAEIPDIRFGLVSYKDDTHRDQVLTTDVAAFKSKVNLLVASGGGDYPEGVELALQLAYGSSWRAGDVAKVVILIGDAPPHDTPGAVAAATAAYVDEYGIYTNAIAADSGATIPFQQIATAGHGTYAFKADPADLADEIIGSIKTVVPSIDTAGKNVVVKEVVPSYIVASGFNPAPTTSVGNTHTWNLGDLGIGETKTITFSAKCTEAGDDKLVDVYPDTKLIYDGWSGSDFDTLTDIPFPETYIDCKISNKPPTANAGHDQTVEQDSLGGAEVTLDGSASTDDGKLLPLTYSWTWVGGSASGVNPTVTLPLGTTTVTLTVDDGQFSATDTVDIKVVDTTKPVLTLPAGVTVEQATKDGTVVPLTATATDICDADVTITSDAPAIFPLGSTTVTFTATDDSGNVATGTVVVKVVDTTAPSINVNAEPIVLWPPNHKYQTIAISDFVLSATDICDTVVGVAEIAITSVSSDEPEEVIGNGDGNTMKDIVIVDSNTVNLRSERKGAGNGRVYTINFEVTDASGNTATGSYKVEVPHDQSGPSAVDDGAAAGYTVTYP